MVSGSVTAVLAFVVGFGLAVLDRGTETRVVAAPPTTVTGEAPATTSSTSTTIVVAPPPSVEPPTTPPTTAVPSTRPPTTAPPPPTVVTVPPTSAAAPAQIQVNYPRDAQGRLVLAPGRSSQISIRNVGGSLGQYLVQPSGYVSVTSPTSGALRPGELVQVTVRASPEPPGPGVQGSVTVTGAAVGTISIPVFITG